MPKLEAVDGFKKGDTVAIRSTSSRGIGDAASSSIIGEVATVAFCYASDQSAKPYVYITLGRPNGHHPRTDSVTGNTTKGDPIYGPFAFAPSDLEHAA